MADATKTILARQTLWRLHRLQIDPQDSHSAGNPTPALKINSGDFIEPFIRATGLDPTQYFWLIDRNGDCLAHEWLDLILTEGEGLSPKLSYGFVLKMHRESFT